MCDVRFTRWTATTGSDRVGEVHIRREAYAGVVHGVRTRVAAYREIQENRPARRQAFKNDVSLVFTVVCGDRSALDEFCN